MRFSKRGIPIFSLKQKCEALEYCLREGHNEDAEGHIWDLLHIIYRDQPNPYVPELWAERMREKFGKPTPITRA